MVRPLEANNNLICPDWPAPETIGACITTRLARPLGTGSDFSGSYDFNSPYDFNNLALHVGDNPDRVRENRESLRESLGLTFSPQWLEQVHGAEVVEADVSGRVLRADAGTTNRPGLACAVLTADCLPVLFCNKDGSRVAVAHAGWRGLAEGVLSNTLAAFAQAPEQVLAYLGPAISQPNFEVGAEVLEAFRGRALGQGHLQDIDRAFSLTEKNSQPSSSATKYHADLYQLARAELKARGVDAVYGGQYCTYRDAELFYSHRRQSPCGRMASLIWIKTG